MNNMMKHLSKWFITAFAGVALFSSSCVDQVKFGDGFLEKAPGVAVTQDTIFGKATYARAFLWDTYSKLYYGLPVYWNAVEGKMNTGVFEMMSDCWHSHTDWNGVNRKYYSGSYKAGDEDSGDDTRFGYTKENCWEAIRAAWLFIENVDKVPDMEEAEKKRLIAEAKVIVASRYFDLFRHLGGLPLIKETYDVQPSYELPRATVEETVNYMVNLLDEAAATPQLPWDLGTDDMNWQGRFTKASAMGLKCKILLFAASPLFNDDVPYCTESPQDAVTNHQVWYGAYKPELWEQCWQACVDFFAELESKGYYELTQATEATIKGYRNAYNKAYFTRENNKELLISTHVSRFGKFNSWDEWQYIFVNSGNGTVITGGLTPTLEFMEMFPMSDGNPFRLDNTTNPFYTDNDYNKPIRDPRLYETMLVNGTQFGDHAAELWIGGRDNVNDTEKETGKYATGFGCYKFYKEGINSLKDKYLQWPYLRLAEMYLIYAEALLQHKHDLTGAIEQVNKVRARVGLGDLAACNPSKSLTTDSDALLEEILRERACELGLEDVRLFDMIRYKREDLFKKQLHGLKIYRNDGAGNTPWSGSTGNSSTYPKPTQFTYEAFPLVNPSRAWWSNFSPKWYLSAFPPSEVNKNYGLTQNPGWN
ncbi:RagB/SusD family nutrient uptake outer membrane protein [Bacteroides caecimuris]|uniref:RagB/SusD family nutrient uptake outer membrane protein n=1 Tax=Bacteroides caecimuris TaxID=1796613 RepID=A0A4S2D3X3_9BACE|nr:RagB/SusD family nutrient uptake outer membrane protein [Bacteroides caecimuris]TGY34984.1 RagB/SusD family nutrient uptake outer membrane protein [Bacteroides caecimuris]